MHGVSSTNFRCERGCQQNGSDEVKVIVHMNPDDVTKPGKVEIEGSPNEIAEYMRLTNGGINFGK